MSDAHAPLVVEDVYKSFGGVEVLRGVALTVNAGQRVSLIGANGAGKTTLFNVVTRLTAPDKGRLSFDGRDLLRAKPHELLDVGIARTFQHSSLFGSLSVLENLLVPQLASTPPGAVRAGLMLRTVRRLRQASKDRAIEVLEALNLANLSDERARDLPYPLQKRVEIARALVTRPRLLILDEPAGGITRFEVEDLEQILRSAQESLGFSLLLIEHNMRFVMGLSDYVYVLHHGVPLADGRPEEIGSNPDVVDAYLGPRK